MEIWKEIPGFEDYEISSLGRVRNKLTQYVKKPYAEKRGYVHMHLRRDMKSYNKSMHRLMFAAFVGPIPEGLDIAHLDGNKQNNSISNLHACTSKENHSHRVLHGTHLRGECSPNAKLKSADVLYIRSNPDKLSLNQLARKFGVSKRGVLYARDRRNWKHI